ncbi:hypothetical protein [Clostridium beijerinckii]|uniref:Uncharacterized protein n=1 Tax=Clostridium beijerinckii TaxID=1520 RepID=A0AAW3WDA0_CLOBE|nr:hypothetical protein [Clostridium beijerinckii]MBC2459398.1 hypothetical protein [Clostridium beijerinckii]MBC2476906.1 hypothetical protein [Clostridium beijerinckii]NOV62732.1 orotate phosphoribosyltransferase-like protein [Clostridium beijerinckii]NOV70306.1 orotate phosphoribosyltransferase-like protein [Clostridium beijerinckii]NOW30786.1 orotate phosphoribosyltransferase-like protein [Clostridium beijerinckii]
MKREDNIKSALSLANKGFTRNEIIEKLNISRRTLERYQKINSELATKIKENEKEISQLIKTAFKLAKGYATKVQKVVKVKDGYEMVEVEEIVAPNADMIKYLLNNRDRLNYSNNPNKDRIDKELLELKKKANNLGLF